MPHYQRVGKRGCRIDRRRGFRLPLGHLIDGATLTDRIGVDSLSIRARLLFNTGVVLYLRCEEKPKASRLQLDSEDIQFSLC